MGATFEVVGEVNFYEYSVPVVFDCRTLKEGATIRDAHYFIMGVLYDRGIPGLDAWWFPEARFKSLDGNDRDALVLRTTSKQDFKKNFKNPVVVIFDLVVTHPMTPQEQRELLRRELPMLSTQMFIPEKWELQEDTEEVYTIW